MNIGDTRIARREKKGEIKVLLIGSIPYQNIANVDWNGDEYYSKAPKRIQVGSWRRTYPREPWLQRKCDLPIAFPCGRVARLERCGVHRRETLHTQSPLRGRLRVSFRR